MIDSKENYKFDLRVKGLIHSSKKLQSERIFIDMYTIQTNVINFFSVTEL